MTIFGVSNLWGGLNNQRLALFGLLQIAKERSAHARFPSQMVDYVPRGIRNTPPRLFFPDLYDVERFKKAMLGEPVTGDLQTDLVTFKDCFAKGFDNCFSGAFEVEAMQFMTSLVASPKIVDVADAILAWRSTSRMLTLQLRIERDWQNHLAHLHSIGQRLSDDNIVDSFRLFEKLRSDRRLDKFDTIWACCDEEDLTVPREEIKKNGLIHGFEVLFKRDISKHIEIPRILLMRSMLDFTICLKSETYVGLTRSTFSKLLFQHKKWGRANFQCFDYNSEHGKLKSY